MASGPYTRPFTVVKVHNCKNPELQFRARLTEGDSAVELALV